MFTKSFTSLRRLSGYVLTMLLFCVSFSKGAEAQATAPLVTGSFATSLTAPSKLGTVEQTALDNYGNWLVVDYANGALYEYPANGGAMITLAPPGMLGGANNPGIAIDSNNNLYLGGNWNNCVALFPYDTTTGTWDGFATLNAVTNTVPDQCGIAPFGYAEYSLISTISPNPGVNYIQPWGMAMLPGNVLVMGNQDGTTPYPGWIMTLPIVPGPAPAGDCGSGTDEACSPYDTPGPLATPAVAANQVLLAMTKRPNSVAADKFGNIYFVEDSGGLLGAYMIPAGETNVPSDTDPSIVQVSPTSLANVTAVATDSSGNVYISDSVAGVFMVPNPSGTPNPSAAVMLTSVPATGQVSVDSTRGILYVPTTNGGLTKVTFSAALGATPAGAPAATSSPVTFSFTSAEGAFPVIQEAGTTTPDFVMASGGTCASKAVWATGSSCTVNVTLSPHSAGNVSAKLLMLNPAKNVLGSIILQGTGTGSAIQVLPGEESAIDTGLKTPNEVAVDAAGNTYVADSGLAAVEFYPKGAVAATSTVGTLLTAPTGVAVDGGGDVFIADSPNVIEVPEGGSGLNTAGQVTVDSGLGTKLNLAVDGVGNLYISDPDNHRVVKLGNPGGSFGLLGQTETDLTGFNAPSAVAVDASGNLYVADGSNLIEVTPAGTQTTLLSTLSGATGLAVDSSGSVYVAMPGGTVRIPNESGTLNPADQTTVATNPTVTNPTSVAIDSAENQYITDATAEDVEFVGASASANFGTLATTTSSLSSSYTILDVGNSPLNVSGFTSTPDYSVTSTTCTGGAVAVDSTCSAAITFNPGPGDQGTLSGEVLATSDAANSPVGVNVTGVGATLADSTTAVSVANATVDGAPTVITVTSTAGTGAVPTGMVTLTITGPTLTAPEVVTGQLVNGAVTITPPQIPAGTYTFSVSYQGDRVYGTSNASTQVVVAVGAVTLTQATLTPSLSLYQSPSGQWYVLAAGTGSDESYDGSAAQFEFTYEVSVAATDGVALIGQPVYNTAGTEVVGTNYGSITYEGAPYSSNGTGCPPVPVASTGAAPLGTDCLTIDTSNTAIPDLENTYTITPVYSPAGTGSTDCNPTCVVNPNYASATGTPITLTALRNPVVQISSSPSSLSISPGSTATATLTLTSVLGYGISGAGGLLNNYSLPVQLECDGLPAYASCSFNYSPSGSAGPDPTDPQSVDVGPPAGTVLSYMNGTAGPCAQALPGAIGGCFGPGTVIMTINTNIPSGVASLHSGQGEVAFAAMFGLGLLGFAFGKKKSVRGRILTLGCLVLCGGIMASISGCSTKQFGTAAENPTVTPAGTYAVMVTAMEVGSQVISADPGITYGNGNQVSLPFTMNVTIQ